MVIIYYFAYYLGFPGDKQIQRFILNIYLFFTPDGRTTLKI